MTDTLTRSFNLEVINDQTIASLFGEFFPRIPKNGLK